MNILKRFDVMDASSRGHVVYWKQCHEQRLCVREDHEFRWLLSDSVIQSVLVRDLPSELTLPHQIVLQAICPAHVRQILHLGLGGGDLIRWCHYRYPAVKQTAVELNPDVVNIYQNYFQQQESPTLVVGDAFHFLSETNAQFDLIILDVFAIDGAPAPIFHAETYLQLKRCLTETGQVIVNLLPRTENERLQVLDLMKAQLGSVQSLQVAEYRNHLIWSTPATKTSPDHH